MLQFNSLEDANRTGAIWILPETLQDLASMGEADLVADIIETFKSDTAQRMILLRQSLDHGDGTKVREQAHAIKGSSVQVGANSLADLCRQLELLARTQPCDELQELAAQAELEFSHLLRALPAS